MSEGGFPSDLPKGWTWARLDEVAEVRLGRQRSPKNHVGTHMRPYLRAANVGWNGLKLGDVKEMNFTDDEVAVYRLRKGDIVLGEASGSPSEVGKPAIWNNEIADCCLQNTLIRVRSYGVNPYYLLYFLRSEALRGAFVEKSRGVGIFHIGAARLAAWQVPVPPLEEQQRIVHALEEQLSRLDVASKLVADAKANATTLLRSIWDYAASGQIANEWEISSASVTENLANDWQWRTPAELTDGSQGSITIGPFGSNLKVSDYAESGVPLVFVRNIRSADFTHTRHISKRKAENLEAHSVEFGDLLITKMGDPPGDAAAYKEERGAVITADCIRLRPAQHWNVDYLVVAVNSTLVRRQIESATRGVAQRKVSLGRFRNEVRIPTPPAHLQEAVMEAVNERVFAIGRLQETLVRAEKRAAALRRSLLAEAFAGGLVSQDPSEEPAEALLTRMRSNRDAARTTQLQRRSPRRPAGRHRRDAIPLAETPPPATSVPDLASATQPTLDMEFPS
ncbi:restriction endonuclease subunit S [Streptomyces sp. NPDC058459]|uniref:restriction endonuclease subunit S n=1 Tax=Streptomyces sp. NPDC058459 TaxID=3346508 RepID=UPI0036557C2E